MSFANICLAIWFLLYGIFALVSVAGQNFPQSNIVLAALALVVAILLLVGR